MARFIGYYQTLNPLGDEEWGNSDIEILRKSHSGTLAVLDT